MTNTLVNILENSQIRFLKSVCSQSSKHGEGGGGKKKKKLNYVESTISMLKESPAEQQ